MPEHRNVRKFLDLSTAHLKPGTREEWTLNRPTHVHATEYGFFVWAGDRNDEMTDDGWPEEAVACRRFARQQGCDYLLFDADADRLCELEEFE